jgi:quercetin dioxygenase-like cupin family protein
MAERTFVKGFGGEYGLKEERKRRLAVPRVIHTKDLPWGTGPNHWNRDILRPDTEPFRTQTLDVHMEAEAPGNISHKHGHQNEALFYILEGRGHEIHDGKRYEWKAGDLVVVHNDSVHQHWNDDPEHPTRALIIKAKPLWLFMGLMQQAYVERSSTEDHGFRPED